MSENKHTPGPWRVGPVDDTVVTDATGREVAAIDGDYNDPDTWPVMEANARLIAAAPDLLEAAKFALPALEDEASMRKPDDPIRVAAYVMRTAIAKAEGSASRSTRS